MAKKMTSIELDEELLYKYKNFAKERDLTFKQLVRQALNEYIERHKEDEQ